MPHGYCYMWNPLVLWLHVVSDGLITLSYYCIPIVLIYFIRKNRDIPFNRIFWMFGIFILACGTTHLMEIWNVWHASYLLAGVIKAITAVVSVITAAMLIPLVPKVISLPGRIHLQEINQKLKEEIAKRQRFDAPVDAALRKRVAVGFVVAILLTGVIGVLSWRGARRAEDDTYWVSHTHQVMEGIQRTSRHVIEAETSARAFALTGQEPLLLHYETSRDTISQDENTLRHLTADNLSQQRRLDVLDSRVRVAISFAESIITKRRSMGAYPGADDALKIEQDLDTIRATTRDMYSEESRLLIDRTRTAQGGQQLTRIIAIVGTILLVGLWGLAKLAVNREITISEGVRRQLSALNAELEGRVKQRTAALESEIAERKRTAEARERLAAVVESSDDAIISKTLKGVITSWNSGARQMFGYSLEEAVGQPMLMLFQAEHANQEADILAQIGRGESVEHFEAVRVRKDGKTIDISATISPIRDASGTIVGASTIARDITAHKRAQEALRQSDIRREFALETARVGDWDLDLTTLQATRSSLHDQIFGYPSPLKEWNFDIFLRHVHPDDRERVRETFQSSVRQGKKSEFECRIVWPNGDIRWIWACGDQNRDASGNATRMFGIVQDISERKRSEEALLEQAQVLDLAQVLVRDMQSRIVLWNRGAENLYGYTKEEAMGRVSHELLHTEFPYAAKEVERDFESAGTWEGELIHRRRDGNRIAVSSLWVLHRDAQGNPRRILEVNSDITARKEAEKQLAQQADQLYLQSEELIRSGEALEAQTLMLQSVLDSIDEGLVAADENGKFILWNPAATRIVGMGAEDVTPGEWNRHYGVYLPDTITPLPKEQNPLTRAIQGEVSAAEIFVRNPELDEGVWLEISGSPLKGKGGAARGGVVAFRDITDRKQTDAALARSRAELEAKSQMLNLVLESMGEGLIAADREGHFLIWNDSARKLLGRGAADLPRDQWSPYYKAYLADGITPAPTESLPLVRALKGESLEMELMIKHPEREEGVFLEFAARPMKDLEGNLCGGVVAFRDITQRRSDEREIRKLNDQLEARVVERTAQLQAANKELESFTYSVSHDLRAPLRHISGFTRIMAEEFGPTLPAEAQHFLERIEQGASRMGQLVDELLNLARVGRQALALQASDLNVVVKDVISMLEPEMEGRQVEWKIGELPTVECDPILIRQVFQNLIGNALKYSRPRSPAVIEIDQRRKDGRTVMFVRDNGVGFSMKYVDKLFGVFQRLHRAEDFEGTGVGLATVHRIVQKHGGRVWAEAEVDRGSTFYFMLGSEPAATEAASAAVGRNT